MKITVVAIVLLFAVILTLAWRLRSDIDANRQLSQEITELRSKLVENSKRGAFERQKECGSQATKVFTEWGWKLSDPTAAFESHYNSLANTCFMVLHIRTLDASDQMESTLLYDANEQREYAELIMFLFNGTTRHIAQCELMPQHGDKYFCKSEAEFEAFVARYMQ
jgi:hypothetical protein